MDPGFIQAKLQKANELLDDGKPDDALRCLGQVEGHLFETDDKIEYASLRAWALAQLDRGQQALDELAPLLEEFPTSARLHATHGVVLSNIDRLEDACDALETAVALDDTDGIALANLGYVYERLEEFERAVEAYDQALDTGADMIWILQRKATAQRDMEDFSAARSTLKRYLSLVPEDDFEWISLAIVHSELGEFDESFDCYRRAESLNPKSSSLRFNWGLTAERAGHMDIARRQLASLCEIEPASTQASILRAFILEHDGKIQPAYAAYMEALDRSGTLDRGEVLYAFERAMEFCTEHDMRREADALFKRAYQADACSVEVCEAYREIAGRHADNAYWFGMLVQLERPNSANGNGNGAAKPIDPSSDLSTETFNSSEDSTDPAVNPSISGNDSPDHANRTGDANRSTDAHRPTDANFSAGAESNYSGHRGRLPRSPDRGAKSNGRPHDRAGRLLRGFQVIGTDRDDAAGIVTEFLRSVGEKSIHISEFTDEEPIEDDYSGIYEVEPEETIADPDGPDAASD